MYDHIIVPVDFDHEALVTQGLQVAKRLLNDGGKVTFVHVLEEIPAIVVSSLPAGTMEKRKQTAQDQLNTLAEAHGANGATVLRHGNPAREIVETARDGGGDCIIVASHKPGLQDYFLGSTAAWVVRHAQCCVHVLR